MILFIKVYILDVVVKTVFIILVNREDLLVSSFESSNSVRQIEIRILVFNGNIKSSQ